MIIIFNLMGAVVGLLGLILGFILLLATGSLAVGLVAVAGIWCWFGRSKINEETGEKRSAPSVFFIPLFYWGLLAAVAALPAVVIDSLPVGNVGEPGADVAADPNEAQFRRDEAGLKTNESDDPDLSAALVLLIAETLPGEAVNVRIKSSDDAVLVLMKLPDLKKISEDNRKSLLEAIRELAEQHRPDVKVYAGIKGKLLYGAVLTPERSAEVGTVVAPNALFAFYQPPASPETTNTNADPAERPDSETAATTELPAEAPDTDRPNPADPQTDTDADKSIQ